MTRDRLRLLIREEIPTPRERLAFRSLEAGFAFRAGGAWRSRSRVVACGRSRSTARRSNGATRSMRQAIPPERGSATSCGSRDHPPSGSPPKNRTSHGPTALTSSATIVSGGDGPRSNVTPQSPSSPRRHSNGNSRKRRSSANIRCGGSQASGRSSPLLFISRTSARSLREAAAMIESSSTMTAWSTDGRARTSLLQRRWVTSSETSARAIAAASTNASVRPPRRALLRPPAARR